MIGSPKYCYVFSMKCDILLFIIKLNNYFCGKISFLASLPKIDKDFNHLFYFLFWYSIVNLLKNCFRKSLTDITYNDSIIIGWIESLYCKK